MQFICIIYIIVIIFFNLLHICRYIELKFDQINKHLRNLASNNKQAIKRAWENTVLNSPQHILPNISNSKWIIWTIMQENFL